MTNGREFDKPCVFQIRVMGNLASSWSDWFEDFTLDSSFTDEETLLTGRMKDQAALYGVLSKLGGLGIPLLSVTRINNDFKPKNSDK